MSEPGNLLPGLRFSASDYTRYDLQVNTKTISLKLFLKSNFLIVLTLKTVLLVNMHIDHGQ